MTPEIRRAALRAAAKTALLAALGACGGSSAPAPTLSNTGADPTTAPVATAMPTCNDYLAGLPASEPSTLPEGDPDRERTAIYSSFTNPADRSAPRTTTCCNEVLTKDGAGAEQRFACCAVLDNNLPAAAEPSACTPWGPPCPPEMA